MCHACVTCSHPSFARPPSDARPADFLPDLTRPQFAVEGFQRDKPELLKTLKRHDAQRQSKKSATTSREVSQGARDERRA